MGYSKFYNLKSYYNSFFYELYTCYLRSKFVNKYYKYICCLRIIIKYSIKTNKYGEEKTLKMGQM